MGLREVKNTVHRNVVAIHTHTPGIRKLPFPAVSIIIALVIVNALAWVAMGIVLHFHPALISTAVLSYTLGLRHALDADHISAIDLMTRRLIASGQRPVTVGTFFSLGHSTYAASPLFILQIVPLYQPCYLELPLMWVELLSIVIITSIVVAATASTISSKFGDFSRIGGIIGTSISAAFLMILGLMNIFILYKLVKKMGKLISIAPGQEHSFEIKGAGCLFYLLQKMFKLIDKPWKMYPLGVMFGLGFDTSSEVALLGIASIQGAKGTSIWLILVFPVLFTVGMCLLDTVDGALMMALYTSTALAKDQIAILYYSIVLTIITVVVATVIGFIQMLSLILNVAQPSGKFWEGVAVAGDHYDIIGGAICGSFVVFGGLSVLIYKPWRRNVDRKRQLQHQPQQLQDEDEQAIVLEDQETLKLGDTQSAPEASCADKRQHVGSV